MGGTFGSIVNSSFPASKNLFFIKIKNVIVGGALLGKKSDSDEEKLKENSIGDACAQSVAIIKASTD